jgi:hypothetical protein
LQEAIVALIRERQEPLCPADIVEALRDREFGNRTLGYALNDVSIYAMRLVRAGLLRRFKERGRHNRWTFFYVLLEAH